MQLQLNDLIKAYERLGTQLVPKLINPHSYRGFYNDLAFEQINELIPANKLAQFLNDQSGKTFQGWKGGDYTMSNNTLVWLATEGSEGSAIVDVSAISGSVIVRDDE